MFIRVIGDLGSHVLGQFKFESFVYIDFCIILNSNLKLVQVEFDYKIGQIFNCQLQQMARGSYVIANLQSYSDDELGWAWTYIATHMVIKISKSLLGDDN